MVNDVNTLNGALMELGETMANNLTVMGVQSSASDGLTTLAGKILDIAPSVGGLSLAITVDLYTTPSIIYVGDDFLLRAVVNADYDDTSSSDVDVKGYLQGATVTFKEGSTIIGIARTEADGVATLRIGNVTLGSHNYSAIFDGSGTDYDSANGSLVVNVEHNYSLEFTQEVYVVTGVSAIVECVLLDNGSVVVGETVSLTGSDGSLYSGITNQDGVASFNVAIGSETISFTASYQFVSVNCTVTKIFYYDSAETDNLSNFGESLALRNGSNGISHDSVNQHYILTNLGSQVESMRVITPLTGANEFKFEYDSYCSQIGGSSGFVMYLDANNWVKLTDDCNSNKKYWYGYKDNGSFIEEGFYGNAYTYKKWLHYTYVLGNNYFRMIVTDSNDNVIVSKTVSINSKYLTNNTLFGLDCEWQNNTKTYYKNLKATYL